MTFIKLLILRHCVLGKSWDGDPLSERRSGEGCHTGFRERSGEVPTGTYRVRGWGSEGTRTTKGIEERKKGMAKGVRMTGGGNTGKGEGNSGKI